MTELKLEGSDLEKWGAVILSKEESAKRRKALAIRKQFAVSVAREVRKIIKDKDLRERIATAMGQDGSAFCNEVTK